ncbi:hypothetical protein DFJ77DRAFT_546548 [Powellomyces hirtus]|nr:hypothetical protein DFJ77DRAFT_546548 [Powellomyces hirtus]
MEIVDEARAAMADYYAGNPTPIGGETDESSRRFLEAGLALSPNPEAMARAILLHRQELIAFSRNMWIFFVAMRAAGGRTPAPTPLASQSSSRPSTPELGGRRDRTDRSSRNSRLAREAAGRDGFRCCFTGRHEDEAGGPHTGAHVIPFAVGTLNSELGINFDDMLSCFAPSIMVDRTQLDTIQNVITLFEPAHKSFRKFQWVVDVEHWVIDCLDPSVADLFWVRAARSVHQQPFLCDRNGDNAPDPDYLRLHAALGKLLWASGRAEQFLQIRDDDLDSVPADIRDNLAEAINRIQQEDWRIEVAGTHSRNSR